jgi:hypothetical protein
LYDRVRILAAMAGADPSVAKVGFQSKVRICLCMIYFFCNYSIFFTLR